MKFCILKKVMSGILHNIIRKIAACITLHNFNIAEDGVKEMEEAEDPAGTRENQTTTPLGMNYHPTLLDEDVFTCVASVSHTRDALLEVVQELNMRQPHNNLMWNTTFVSQNGTSIDSAFISPI